MKKKLLAVLLSTAMIFSSLSVYADNDIADTSNEETIEESVEETMIESDSSKDVESKDVVNKTEDAERTDSDISENEMESTERNDAIWISADEKHSDLSLGGNPMAVAASGNLFGFPVENTNATITCGYLGYSGHNGYDLGVATDTPLYSIFSGTAYYYQAYVTSSRKSGSYGNYIKVISDDGKYEARYCHLTSFNGVALDPSIISCQNDGSSSSKVNISTISRGEKHVNEGDWIGNSGSTGNSTGPHCHIELKINGNYVDPDSYISREYCAKPAGQPQPDTKNPILHIDLPANGQTYSGTKGVNNIEISGWVVSDKDISYGILEIVNVGQYGVSWENNPVDLSGYSDYKYRKRFRGAIPMSALTSNRTYQYRLIVGYPDDSMTIGETYTFKTGEIKENTTIKNPILHIDLPANGQTYSGTKGVNNIEISGWVVSDKDISYGILEVPNVDQYGVSWENNPADLSGYSDYKYRKRFRGAIPMSALTSNRTYQYRLIVGYPDTSTTIGDMYSFKTGNLSYRVLYNANGGTGAPASQLKVEDVPLTLSSAVPLKSYSITYNANGGTCSYENEVRYCNFNGWNTSYAGDGTTYNAGAIYTANKEITLYAQWNDPAFGKLPTPTRSGYTFEGWYTSEDSGTKVNADSSVSGNVTLYAHWKHLSNYSLEYDANGGENAPSKVTVSDATTVTVDKKILVRFGYNFLGWSTSPDSKVAEYLPGSEIVINTDIVPNR